MTPQAAPIGSFGHGWKSLLGTRIHAQNGTRPDLRDLAHWCEAGLEFASEVAIAADSIMIEEIKDRAAPLGDRVRALLVSPWFGFTPALNAIVGESRRMDADQVILMSREIYAKRESIESLKLFIRPNVLVVGARLSEEHGSQPGVQPLFAHTSPWNTLAVWNAHLLALTGFPTVSDGHRRDVPAGMEEVVTISLLQHIYGDSARAFLVTSHGIEWRQKGGDAVRDAIHESKMKSKGERAEAQLARMNIPRGTVLIMTNSRASFVVATTEPPEKVADASDPNEKRVSK